MQLTAIKDEEDLETLARVDSTDEPLAKPFREFLEHFGTRVIDDNLISKNLTYYLVIGDLAFVKTKVEQISPRAKHTALIVYGSTVTTIKSLIDKTGSKAILVDAKVPDSRLVSDIFAFIFTAKDKIKDLRNDKTESQLVGKLDYENIDYDVVDKERIKKSINIIFGYEKNPLGKSKNVVEKSKSKKSSNFLNKLFLGLIFVILIFPYFWYLTSLIFSGLSLAVAAKEVYRGHQSLGGEINSFASSWISQSKFTLSIVSLPFTITNHDEIIRNQERLLSLFSDVNLAIKDFGILADKGREVAALMLTTASGSGASDRQTTPALALSQLQSEILSEEEQLDMAATELSYMLYHNTFPFSIARVKNLGLKAQSRLTSVRQNINYISNFLSLYPDLAGFKSPKNYLILFQNSLELRPTGGFIGSLATVGFDSGRLKNLEIHDVYELDGQLKGHVDPPAPIKDLLGEEHWYLRDSNWEPDFTKSATRAAWFYQKETENNVDGVIAISSSFLVDMLKATGPTELRDYNDRITADNFYGKSLYYTQNNFFPGSTQKKDFLGSLANAIIDKITSAQGSTDPHLFFTVAEALNRGDILLYFSDPQVESIVNRFGWAGENPKIFPCLTDKSSCLSDNISVVEANLGVNKANYYVSRNVQNKITLSEDGKVETTTSINFQNKSSADHPSNGSGAYKVYVRFLLPGDTVFEGGTLETTPLLKHTADNKVQVLPYYDEDVVNGKKIIGVAMVVPEQSSRNLVTSFKRTRNLVFTGGHADYRFLYERQPGLVNANVETQITYPIFWTAQNSGGALTFLAKQARLTYNTDLSEDQKIEIKFSK